MDGHSTRSPKDLPIIGYHLDKALYQEEIHRILTEFTYPEGVSARLEMTAKSISEIFTLTRHLEPPTKRFWVLISYLRDTGITLRPSELPILSSYHYEPILTELQLYDPTSLCLTRAGMRNDQLLSLVIIFMLLSSTRMILKWHEHLSILDCSS